FSSRRRHTRWPRDWSSDVCSSDLPHARVLFLGTLSKAMFVSLRLAYVVVPDDLVEPLATIRTQLDGFTPALPQMAMSFFIDEGRSEERRVGKEGRAGWRTVDDDG